MQRHPIILKNVRVHNLKGIDLTLPTNELTVFTGVSGSGKSSLAFDTIYVEGQRRYIESLSTFARRYIGDMSKPDLESASGLSPTISIEQKSSSKNPRSTVGTMTEIYDYLRVLYARIGIPHCPVSGKPVFPQSKERIIKTIQTLPNGSKLVFLAPYAKQKKGEFKEDFQHLLRKGFMRARVDGNFLDLSEDISLDRNLNHDIEIVTDRFTLETATFSRVAEAVIASLELGAGMLILFDPEKNTETLYSTHAYSSESGLYYTSLEPHDFSFNSPSGMCPTCNGLSITQEFDLNKIIDPEKSIAQDCCVIATSYQTVRYGNIYRNLAELYEFDVHTPWKDLPERAKKVFLYGTEKKWTQMHFFHPSRPVAWIDHVQWRGVLYEAKERYLAAKSARYKQRFEHLMQVQTCPSCKGSRLKPYPSATELNGKKIHELCFLPISETLHFLINLTLSPTDSTIGGELVKEIIQRLNFLIHVGLHYLTLDRNAPSLSGGEAQRVRLAAQVGSGLVGITYVLDEPSIGLHPRDNQKLISALQRLRDLGNTVIVVEHDEETIFAADRIVDFGPGPGIHGGTILVNGSLQELMDNPLSSTGRFLSGKESIDSPKKRRKSKKGNALTLIGASHHNLKHVDVTFPLGVFITVTGVSGSGKSSLITDILYPALANSLHHASMPFGKYKSLKGLEGIDKVIAIDQSPIGRNPRSNPATYIKVLDDIRALFAKLPDSVARGYSAGRFSFNVRAGSCPQCHGMGMIRVDMDFLEAQWVVCQNCNSKRFDQETLSVYYKGKNIYDVLQMTIEEAYDFFINIPNIKRKLEVLRKVGMEYMTLGQASTTLSGGEAQRIKLAKELVRPGTGNTLYILDEPTTGLHFKDVKALLVVLQELVDKGNTVLVIEHHMDVIKSSDWIIDLGPEGGDEGGTIVATGPPEKILKQDTATGRALKAHLNKEHHFIHTKKLKKQDPLSFIKIEGAAQNNLKHLSLEIPRGKISICTGPSGSGKSSLAFDTVYAEGQRRYVESLSPYARQFVQQMPKPILTSIEGLSPAIAIEQKATSGNPRSTLGTMTELYDYLRILYAQAGIPYSPETGEEIRSITKETIIQHLLQFTKNERITILAPIQLTKQERFEDVISRLQKDGYVRIRLNHEIYDLDSPIFFDRKRKNELALVIDRIKVTSDQRNRLAEAIEKASQVGNKKVLILKNDEEVFFNLAFGDQSTGKSYPEITPHTFSFNHAEGMCPDCQGLGYQYGANFTKFPEIMELTIGELLFFLWDTPHLAKMESLMKKLGFHLKTPLSALSSKELRLFLNGSKEDEWFQLEKGVQIRWQGIQPTLAKTGKSAFPSFRETLIPLLDEVECLACKGTRLNALARHVRLGTVSLPELCQLSLRQACDFIQQVKLTPSKEKVLSEVLFQIKNRMQFLLEVGLEYLSLDRRAPTLSNGETQRIRLARQLGTGLTGALYVLDEPTIGLHPFDNHRLNNTLRKLQALGNTLLIVEHDPMTLKIADYLFDFGPGAGEHGGHLIAQGTYDAICQNPHSLTGKYLSGRLSIEVPNKRRSIKNTLKISGASKHNLKNFSFEIPLNLLTCITGVSGSGKSTLLHEVIQPQVEQLLPQGNPFDKLIVIDQNPIGHTSRSDVGTYVDLLTPLRSFWAQLNAAKAKGLEPLHFSYNHKRGMCTHCAGLGYKKVELLFLPSVKVKCEECQGMRLNPISLSIEYKGMNFGTLLNMGVEQVLSIFSFIPRVKRICETLMSVGLQYLKVGQEVATLSGGEAQRIKLSRELSKRGTGKTLYLLDEPTTGLHPDDIKKLLNLLHRLVDKKNTMVIIEHQVDVIKNSDYVIELGPGAGEKGGEIVCMGTPEEIAANTHSLTGGYLALPS